MNSNLYKEKAIQERLQHALDEAQLSNEIISSIAKTYQYVSRIDIQMDYYEEIANRAREHMSIKRTGIVSVTNQKLCEERIADAYQNVFLKFVDLKTLSERMKNEETIAIEYRMKDGSWHKLRFIEKKRDENGLLTHVLCVIRSISDEKKKEHELMYQVSEAKKEVAFKTRFLSNMSHDIRTPINGIMGMIELANRYPDDPVMQQKCRDKMMESSKYLVSLVNAADGLKAVKKFENSTPGYYDAIFMDIMMPNLNGWDATRKIRSMKREDAENVPIIAISANAFVEDIINSRISGMNEHLIKPLSEQKLIKALKECVGARLEQE